MTLTVFTVLLAAVPRKFPRGGTIKLLLLLLKTSKTLQNELTKVKEIWSLLGFNKSVQVRLNV